MALVFTLCMDQQVGEVDMKIAVRIQVARHAAKLSQEALAEKLEVTRGAVANWECTDGTIPASHRLGKIATITGVSYEWLATGRGRMSTQHDLDDVVVPAVDALFVDDPLERRLVMAFRSAPARVRQLMLEMAEPSLKKARG